ncbi:MAG TPA: amidohydrolase [Myxococcota bacterium]|nr:amidohydrolase [Myxococcota bacterium]
MPFRWSARLALAATLALSCARLGSGPATPAAGAAAPAPKQALLLRGASVMTGAGPTLDSADVLVQEGRIAAVAASLSAPAGARVVDVHGRFVTPGIIDPHSHMGVYSVPNVVTNADGNEMTGPFKPEVRAEDSFWPQDPAIERALAGGVTTIHVLPGSANLIGGQGVTLRLVRALSAREMRFPDAPATMKMACGENPMRVYGGKGQPPQTRMAEVAMLRQELEGARAYKLDESKGHDFANEALASVLAGETLIENHCYRADEMLLRIDLFKEFGIAPRAFHHAVEAYKIRDRLHAAGVGAVVWADWWGFKMELLDAIPANAALLDEAGVTVALHSDSADDVQRLNQEAAKARAAGLRAGLEIPRERALRWITANPAWVLGIDRRVGTLEPGKDADLVVWSGDPLSVYARAQQVFIQGELVYLRGESRPPRSDFELGLPGTP